MSKIIFAFCLTYGIIIIMTAILIIVLMVALIWLGGYLAALRPEAAQEATYSVATAGLLAVMLAFAATMVVGFSVVMSCFFGFGFLIPDGFVEWFPEWVRPPIENFLVDHCTGYVK